MVKLTPDVKSVQEFYKTSLRKVQPSEIREVKPLKSLEQDVFQFSKESPKDDLINNVDSFFRENEYLSEESNKFNEFYEQIQYSTDDVPLAENLKPAKSFTDKYSNTSYAPDTHFDEDSVHKLKRIYYYDKLNHMASKYAKEDVLTDMAYTAAELSFKMPERNVTDLISKSMINGKTPSHGLLKFLAKYPGYRKHVVKMNKFGFESYDPVYGAQFGRMLEITKNVPEIKRALADSMCDVPPKPATAKWLTSDLAINIMDKTETWGNDESELMNTVINADKNKLDLGKVSMVKELLNQDLSIKEITSQLKD